MRHDYVLLAGIWVVLSYILSWAIVGITCDYSSMSSKAKARMRLACVLFAWTGWAFGFVTLKIVIALGRNLYALVRAADLKELVIKEAAPPSAGQLSAPANDEGRLSVPRRED